MARRRSFAGSTVRDMLSAAEACAERPNDLPGYEARHSSSVEPDAYTKPINVLLTPSQHFTLSLVAQKMSKDAPKPTQDELVRHAIVATWPDEYETAKAALGCEE